MNFSARILQLTALVCFLLAGDATGQEYAWPTGAGERIVATFGDMRPRRYHAGMDISTNGGTGYDVYAVEDGFVERILVGTQGYGKALYLRLKDNRLVVYAHLQRFAPRLENRVLAMQQRQGRYALDLRFQHSQYPVRRGDVIAYTGDTGTLSGPHLHFELRDPRNRPINPLTNGFEFEDEALPEIASLAVIPLAPETVAHGSTLPSVVPVRKIKPGRYTLADTIAVDGPFGLAVEAYDRLPNMRYRPTLYGLSLTVDGIRHYSIQFDRYRFDEGRLVELERDYAQWRKEQADFHRLFTTPANDSLSFIRPGSRAAIRLTPGYHRFTIKVWDKALNMAILRGVLAYTPPSRMEATVAWSDEENGWIVTLDSSTPLRRYHAFFYDVRGRMVDQFSHNVPQPAGKQQRFVVPRKSGRRRIVQIIGTDRWGARMEPVHVSLIPIQDVTRMRRFTLQTEHLDNGVVLQVSSDYYLPFPPELLLRTGNGVHRFPTRMVSPVDYLSPTLSLAQVVDLKEVIVRVSLDPVYEVRLPVSAVVADPASKGQLTDPSENLTLEFLPGTFYDSTYVWISRADADPPDGARFVLQPMEVGPFTRPFNRPLGLRMQVPGNRLLPEHAGIFYLDRKEGWEFMTPAGDTDPYQLVETRSYHTLTTSGETFALIEETDPPRIEMKWPAEGGTYQWGDLRHIRFHIDDPVAGIRDETAISLTLDGVARIFEYNTYRETATYVLPKPLERGQHEVIITASDQVGNAVTKTVTFSVQ